MRLTGTDLVLPARMCWNERPEKAEKPRRQPCSTGRENVRSGVWGDPNKRIGVSKRTSRCIACIRYRNVPKMNGELSGVVISRKLQRLKHVGAMSDNSIDRTLAQASIYGNNIISLPTMTIRSIRLWLDLSTPASAGSFNI